jgi:hypothetical protein
MKRTCNRWLVAFCSRVSNLETSHQCFPIIIFIYTSIIVFRCICLLFIKLLCKLAQSSKLFLLLLPSFFYCVLFLPFISCFLTPHPSFFFFFLVELGLFTGFPTCKAGTPSLELCLQSLSHCLSSFSFFSSSFSFNVAKSKGWWGLREP